MVGELHVQRKIILFHLVKSDDSSSIVAYASSTKRTINELRKRAFAASQTTKSSPRQSKNLYYERSADVRDYVLARADGVCEYCKSQAPFLKPDGTPYLEPHHIRKLSDGGPDHPIWVAGVCPNCHREAHYGKNKKHIKQELKKTIARKENVK